jgi:L-arabinose isomerase
LSSATMAQRVARKSSSVYSNTGSDLVDAVAAKTVAVNKVPKDDLPESMRGMSDAEREAFVQEQADKRAQIQVKVKALSAEREAYVTQERKRLAGDGGATLGDVVVSSVRQQLKEAGFDTEAVQAAE